MIFLLYHSMIIQLVIFAQPSNTRVSLEREERGTFHTFLQTLESSAQISGSADAAAETGS
jgi:hypothetical protein